MSHIYCFLVLCVPKTRVSLYMLSLLALSDLVWLFFYLSKKQKFKKRCASENVPVVYSLGEELNKGGQMHVKILIRKPNEKSKMQE